MSRRAALLALAGLAAASLSWASVTTFTPKIVFNPTPSLPIGLYRITPIQQLRRGDLVVVSVPERYRSLAIERGYLGADVALIKRVAALPGDHVCARNRVVTINGKRAATALERDSAGRHMPIWKGCRRLRSGEVFTLIAEVQTSFDSRYIGPILPAAIIGKATRLWGRP